MREMSSVADPHVIGCGRAVTSCIWLRLSNAVAKTFPEFPVVRAIDSVKKAHFTIGTAGLSISMNSSMGVSIRRLQSEY